MKKIVIVALVCINVALLIALLSHSTPTANAQAYHGHTDYIVLTGRIGTDTDGVYIVDLAKRKMICYDIDKTQKKLTAIRARNLKSDFGRDRD